MLGLKGITEYTSETLQMKVTGILAMMDKTPIDGLATIKVEAAPLRSKIIESIRHAVEHGILKPGNRLIERDLCDQLGVSRTSLREALRELESEGIVANVSARGLTVVKISHHDASNIYRIRGQIEALIFEQFTENASDKQLVGLQPVFDQLIAAYHKGDFLKISHAKARWHSYICDTAQNLIARTMLSRLTLRTAQLRNRSVVRTERQQQSIIELQDLMTAIKSRNAPLAADAARRHVINAGASALRFVDDDDDPNNKA